MLRCPSNVAPLLRRTREERRPQMPDDSIFRWFVQVREGIMRPWSKCERHAKRCVRESTPTIGAYDHELGVG
jgi:hypothetical protein